MPGRPNGQPTTQTDVTVSIAERRKTVRVFGDRVWRGGSPTAPAAFQSMPLVWERAFGGLHRTEDKVFAEERNPDRLRIPRQASARRDARDSRSRTSRIRRHPLQSLGQTAGARVFRARPRPSWLPRRSVCGNLRREMAEAARALSTRRLRSALLPVRGARTHFRPLSAGRRARGDPRREQRTGPIGFTLPTARPDHRGDRRRREAGALRRISKRC